jgi:hypothetical protein
MLVLVFGVPGSGGNTWAQDGALRPAAGVAAPTRSDHDGCDLAHRLREAFIAACWLLNRLGAKPHWREEGSAMSQIVLEAQAGQVSGQLARRGIPSHTRVHVLVEMTSGGELSMAAIAHAGKGLDWLAEEPELYSDADLVEPAR